MPRTWLASFCLCTLLFTASTLGAQESQEDGAVAPADRWLMTGGAAARTGAASTAPLTDALREAWRIECEGRIVGEPLVWDDWVVLEVVGRKEQPALHLIRLTDGKLLYKTRGYETTGPLAPCLGRGTVIARTGPNELTVYRLERKRLALIWKLKTEVPAGAPLILGREIYFHNGRDLMRYQFGRDEPVWKATGKYRSRLSVRGQELYLLRYDGEGVGWLETVSRKTGRTLQRRQAAFHQGSVPDPRDEARIFVGRDRVYVRLGLEVQCEGGQMANAIMLSRKVRADGSAAIGLGGFIELPSTPTFWKDRALRVEGCRLMVEEEERQSEETTRAWIIGRDEKDDRLLAHKYFHRSLLDVKTPPTVVRNACYLGSVAFDLATLQVFWRQPIRSRTRLVPARGRLLAMEGETTLVAYRERNTALVGTSHREEPADAKGPGKVIVADRGEAYLRSGVCERGTFEIRPEIKGRLVRVAPRSKIGSWRLADVMLLLDRAGRPVYSGGRDDVIKVVDRRVDEAMAAGYEKLLLKSCSTHDAALIERLLAEAWLRGASAKAARKAERKLKVLETKSPRVNKRLVAKIERDEKGLLGRALGRFEAPLAGLNRKEDRSAKIAYLRAILQRDPDRPVAVAAVKEMLPKGITAPRPFLALDWLDFLEATEATPISWVEAPAQGAEPSLEQRALAAARKSWRPDVVAIQSDRLFILTPLTRPGRIARCLSMGELVCDHLDSQFSPLGSKRGKGHRLKIHLHETQEEYIQQSGGAKVAGHLKWAAGHYNKRKRHSRMFLPEGAEAFEQVMDVFAHELTHQWVDERCPLFSEAERFRSPFMQPCFWIVEGIASWMEQSRFDLERGVIQTFNPRCRHLDILASLVEAKGPRIDWKDLFSFTQIQFAGIPREPERGFVAESHWRLGALHQLSWTQLFYVQSAAATQYLMYAEKGKHRRRLLECVGHYYKGHYLLVDVKKAFGLTPEELGRRIEAFARQVRKGWKPSTP